MLTWSNAVGEIILQIDFIFILIQELLQTHLCVDIQHYALEGRE
jgi:hypothetical protein